jgi:hypothetical protein
MLTGLTWPKIWKYSSSTTARCALYNQVKPSSIHCKLYSSSLFASTAESFSDGHHAVKVVLSSKWSPSSLIDTQAHHDSTAKLSLWISDQRSSHPCRDILRLERVAGPFWRQASSWPALWTWLVLNWLFLVSVKKNMLWCNNNGNKTSSFENLKWLKD